MLQRAAKLITAASVTAIIFNFRNSSRNPQPTKEKISYPTSSEKEWESYYQKTQNNSPDLVEPIYLEIVKKLEEQNPKKELKALDLGTGTGVVALLAARGTKPKGEGCSFQVIAEDMNRNALDIVNERAKQEDLQQCIRTRQRDLSNNSGPNEQYDLITARSVLPFLPQDVSVKTIIEDNISQKLATGGNAVIGFFGPRHPWCSTRQCHTKEEIQGFFSGFKRVEILDASEPTVLLASGKESPWHQITAVAYK